MYCQYKQICIVRTNQQQQKTTDAIPGLFPSLARLHSFIIDSATQSHYSPNNTEAWRVSSYGQSITVACCHSFLLIVLTESQNCHLCWKRPLKTICTTTPLSSERQSFTRLLKAPSNIWVLPWMEHPQVPYNLFQCLSNLIKKSFHSKMHLQLTESVWSHCTLSSTTGPGKKSLSLFFVLHHRYWKATVWPPQSFLSSRLNTPNSFSLSSLWSFLRPFSGSSPTNSHLSCTEDSKAGCSTSGEDSWEGKNHLPVPAACAFLHSCKWLSEPQMHMHRIIQ